MSAPELPRLWTGEAVLDRALEVAGLARPKNRKGCHDAHRRRLEQFDALTGCSTSGSTPDRLLTQARQHLTRLAEREARQEQRRTRRRKETPMPERPYNPGGIVQGPREEPAKPVTNGRVPGIPEVVAPFLARFELLFRTPSAQPSAVLTHEAYRLAGVLLDCPEKDRVHILARILFRFGAR